MGERDALEEGAAHRQESAPRHTSRQADHAATARGRRRRRRTVIALAAGLAILIAASSAALLTLRHRGALTGGIDPAAIARAIRNAADEAGAASTPTMPADRAAKDYPFQPSPVDYNGNGIDDYTDILRGAQADSRARPAYDDGY